MAERTATRADVSSHPNAQVAKRRGLLLQLTIDKDPSEHGQNGSRAVGDSSSLTITLSAEGQARLMEVAQDLASFTDRHSATPEACASLRALTCQELSKGELLIPVNSLPTRELRQMLIHYYSTASASPAPQSLVEDEHMQLVHYLSCFILLKTPMSSLMPELEAIKRWVVIGTVKAERKHMAAQIVELDRIKAQIDDFLASHGEPNSPFHEVRQTPCPGTNSDTVTMHGQGPIASLQERKPEVWARMREKFSVYANKAMEIKGYIKQAN